MGNLIKSKVNPKQGELQTKDGDQKKYEAVNPVNQTNPPQVTQKHEDKKDVNMGEIFDEIMDVKGAEKGAMLLSESIGKPKEQYDTIENIAPVCYGVIKKVRHKISKNIRAMRIIKKELIEVKEEVTLLFKELALLRSLDHPNIVKLFEFFRDEKYYYLISEYCEEGELFKLVKDRNSGYPEASVAYIMKQVLSVVAYCHSGNIINRDLRLENILVESIEWKEIHGDEVPLMNIRISDFKSARSFKNSKKLNKKVGNPYYIAPEVLKRKYNEKCDIWSCGIIAYILLTGKPPFSGNTDKEVLDKVELGVLEFLDKDLIGNTSECKSLIREMLRFDPLKRPSAIDILRHSWFTTNKVEIELDNKFINSSFQHLMQFNPDQRFQQAALSYMVHHLVSMIDVSDMRKMFQLFDTNGDGKLSHNEILDGYKQYIGLTLNDKEFLKVIKKIDSDKSGYVEYEEFIRACIDKETILTEDKLQITFHLFDKDGSGGITPDEMKLILGLTSKYSDKVWNEILASIERNNNDEVTMVEFKNMMLKLACVN